MFITFEGPDGTGKSTQLDKIYSYLVKEKYDVIKTREPGGTKIGDQIRSILLDKKNIDMSLKAEILLYAASRAEHVEKVIKPALNKGQIVLCDRYIDASISYQGYAQDEDITWIKNLNAWATNHLVPDRTYMFDLDPIRAKGRLEERLEFDRIELRDLSFHQKVREGFLQIAKTDRSRIMLLNADNTIENLFQLIIKDLLKKIAERRKNR